MLQDNAELRKRHDVLDRLVSLRHEHLGMLRSVGGDSDAAGQVVASESFLLDSSCHEDAKVMQKIEPSKVYELYELAAERAQQLLWAFASAGSSMEKLESWEEIVRGVQVREFVCVYVRLRACVRACVSV